nr:hypothetical protein [Bacillus cereus]
MVDTCLEGGEEFFSLIHNVKADVINKKQATKRNKTEKELTVIIQPPIIGPANIAT